MERRRRRDKDKRIEQNKKSDQETQEKMHQLRTEYYSTKKQENKRKNLNIINKLIRMSDESYKKSAADIQELEEEWLKKTQEDQQVIDSIPRLVKVELKEAQVHQKAQEDEIQTLEQSEENESTESDHSEILQEAVLAMILGLCEGIGSYRPPDRKGPRFNKYLKDDHKRELVTLVIRK